MSGRAARIRRRLGERCSVGGQYNGGELPTTIILDAEGRVRRRFFGERDLAVFQAMVAEAEKPLTTTRARLQAQDNRRVVRVPGNNEGFGGKHPGFGCAALASCKEH